MWPVIEQNMTINWIPNTSKPPGGIHDLLKLEYNFRAVLTRFLLDNMPDVFEQQSSLYFDFYTETRKFTVSTKTPEPFYAMLADKMEQIQLGMAS